MCWFDMLDGARRRLTATVSSAQTTIDCGYGVARPVATRWLLKVHNSFFDDCTTTTHRASRTLGTRSVRGTETPTHAHTRRHRSTTHLFNIFSEFRVLSAEDRVFCQANGKGEDEEASRSKCRPKSKYGRMRRS